MKRLAFSKDETGAITPLMLVLFIGLALVTGAAIDVVRHEGERADLQDALDRGVLASASLQLASTHGDRAKVETLIKEFVANRNVKSRDATVVLDDDVKLEAGGRRIGASAGFDMPTTIFRMAGISDFGVAATSAALESNQTEISFVIDISGTMRWGNGERSRIETLRPYANKFIESVIGDTKGQVSVNLVPYAGQVNPGREVFEYLGGVRRWRVKDDGTVDRQWLADYVAGNADGTEPGVYVESPANCLELTTADFDIVIGDAKTIKNSDAFSIPTNRPYLATHHFHQWGIDTATMDWGWCPGANARMLVHEGDKDVLKNAIDTMRLHDGTGTYNGMKWGLALLNPRSNDLVQHLADLGLVDESFRNRPLELTDTEAVKVVVLMTDGQITEQRKPKPLARKSGESNEAYQARVDDWLETLATVEIDKSDYGSDTLSGFNKTQGFDHFLDLCAAARVARIEVYTIAFDAPTEAEDQMKACVGGENSGRYFEASTDPDEQAKSIEVVLDAIAREINTLRLFN